MSKKRGGLSAREYLAKQKGGKLNYSSGKISVPVKKTSKPAPLYGAGPLLPGQSRVDNSYSGGGEDIQAGPLMPDGRFYSKQDSNSTDNVKIAKQRETAKKAYASSNALNGMSFANASKLSNASKNVGQSTAPVSTSAPSRGFLREGLNLLKGSSPIIGAMAKGFDSLGIDLTNALGIPDAQAMEFNVGDNPLNKPYEVPEQTGVGGGDRQYFNNYVPKDVNGDVYSDYAPYDGGSSNSNPIHSNKRQSPQKLGGDDIESILGSLGNGVSENYNPVPVEDNTPKVQSMFKEKPGIGSGYLSNGIASNGQGNYGESGLSLGGGQNNETNLLNDLLGIETAQASSPDFQAAGMNFKSLNTPMSSFKNGVQSGGLTLNSNPNNFDFSAQAVNDAPTTSYQGSGGVAQSYAAPVQQNNPALSQYQASIKGYGSQLKDTQKAYKRALASMLKGIESQYAQSQKEGQDTLNKAKAEDLLKQSGLFNFANQDPNSEQRIQYDQRMNDNYATQMANLIAKLTASKNTDILNAKSGIQDKLSQAEQQIMSAKTAAQQNLANLMYSMQQDSIKRYGGESLKYQPMYDNNNNITGTYAIDKNGNIYQNLNDTPFQAKPQNLNILDQLLYGMSLSNK